MNQRHSERVRLLAAGFDAPLHYESDYENSDLGPLSASGHEVVVQVEACGVCHRDLIDRAGRFPFQRFPITPGHEAAGRVVAVGPDVSDFRVGDRVGTMHRDACGHCPRCVRGHTSLCAQAAWVLGILADGGYADQLLAPQSALYPLPDGLAPEHAAILHCTYGTAYRDLRTLGGLSPGERVLITGANGGVGSAAIQIAARLSASVIAVTRSEKHIDYLRHLGADEVVVDAGEAFHKHPAVSGVDLVLEAVGSATFNASLRSLDFGGRMVVIGNIDPRLASVNLGYMITRGLSVTGGSGATRQDMVEVLALHRRRPFEFAVDRTMPLREAEAAQRLVRDGGLRGRVVLVPGQHANG